MNANHPSSNFGILLRSWRVERHLSQAELANAIETPSRHISFLETGRSRPSRNMIARLATALQIPLRDRNILFKTAGFADLFPTWERSDEEVLMLRQAVTRMMTAHDPFPSFVVNRQWEIIDTNESGLYLMRRVDSQFHFDPFGSTVNMIDAVFSPQGFQPFIENWEDYAKHFIQRLHREFLTNKDLRSTLDRIRCYSDLPQDWRAFDVKHTENPMLPIKMRFGDRQMTFFTVVATVALPTNPLAQDLRVETMFPTDLLTEKLLMSEVQQSICHCTRCRSCECWKKTLG